MKIQSPIKTIERPITTVERLIKTVGRPKNTIGRPTTTVARPMKTVETFAVVRRCCQFRDYDNGCSVTVDSCRVRDGSTHEAGQAVCGWRRGCGFIRRHPGGRWSFLVWLVSLIEMRRS